MLMRKTMESRGTMRSLLLANGCVATITSGGALVVLLIAPLGLAAVISCTVLVALLSFCAGLAADVVLWRLLLANDQGSHGDQAPGIQPGGGLRLSGRGDPRLPQRRR